MKQPSRGWVATFRGSPERRESGMAMVAVVFLGLTLMLLTAGVSARAMRQTGNTRSDAQWEQALQVAESGLDHGLALVNLNSGFTTGETMPEGFSGPEAMRAWVVGAAEARPAAGVAVTSNGEYVIVRPANSNAVFAVGFVPGREAAGRRVRVVQAQLGSAELLGGWKARYGVLTGGPLQFIGNPSIFSGSAVGVHSNGYLEVGGSTFINGCMSSAGGAKITGSVVEDPSCQAPGTQTAVVIPVIDPRQLWSTSHFDLCPDGRVRAGPAHPTLGYTAGTTPCTGFVLSSDTATVTFRGWKFLGCCDSRLEARWQQTSGTPYDGVYYAHEGSVDLTTNTGTTSTPWGVTLLVAGKGTCPAITGGDVSISGSPVMRPHPGSSLLIAAGRDVVISGSPNLAGLVAAHEQLKSTGNTEVYEGSFLAEDACDSPMDYIDADYISGTTTLSNTGPISSPFGATIVQPVVVAWDEL